MVRSSLRFILLLKLVVDGSNNSVNLVCHDFGDIEQLSFSSRIASSHTFAVGFSATLLIRMEMLVLWHAFDAKLFQVFEDRYEWRAAYTQCTLRFQQRAKLLIFNVLISDKSSL